MERKLKPIYVQQSLQAKGVRLFSPSDFQRVFGVSLRAAQEFIKGGTALRIIWQSPRFSEDLDFTGVNITIKKIESLTEGALAKLEMEGVQTEIVESKSTSGGYLAIFHFKTNEYES